MSRKICIDMDGTIAKFTEASFKKVKELYGIELTFEDAYKPNTAELVWNRMTEEQRSNFNTPREIYEKLCERGFFLQLEPFEDAIESVKDIYKMGYEIIFLTKAIDWVSTPEDKAEWLKKYFSDIEYKIIMVDSVTCKHIINCDFIVDDDPRVLEGAMPVKLCMERPWNKEYRDKTESVYAVKDMKDVVSILKKAEPILSWWEEHKASFEE